MPTQAPTPPTVSAAPHDELAPPMPNEQLLDSHVVAQRALQAGQGRPLPAVFAACPFYILATYIAMASSPLAAPDKANALWKAIQWVCHAVVYPENQEAGISWIGAAQRGGLVSGAALTVEEGDSYRPVSDGFVLRVVVSDVQWRRGVRYSGASRRVVDFQVAPSLIEGMTLTPCDGLDKRDAALERVLWDWLARPLSPALARRVQQQFDHIYPGAQRTQAHSPHHTATRAVEMVRAALGGER
jgi:hypothetical protein